MVIEVSEFYMYVYSHACIHTHVFTCWKRKHCIRIIVFNFLYLIPISTAEFDDVGDHETVAMYFAITQWTVEYTPTGIT